MKNVRIVYFGEKDVLHLTMVNLPKGREIVIRLDNILPGESPRYREDLLVIGMDDRLINVGINVPDNVLERAVDTNSAIDDGYTGFMVTPRKGYVITGKGAGLVLEKNYVAPPMKGSPEQFEKLVDKIVEAGSPDIREDETVVITEQQVRESKFDLVEAVAREQAAQLPSSMPPKPVESRREKKRKRKEQATDPTFERLAEGL